MSYNSWGSWGNSNFGSLPTTTGLFSSTGGSAGLPGTSNLWDRSSQPLLSGSSNVIPSAVPGWPRGYEPSAWGTFRKGVFYGPQQSGNKLLAAGVSLFPGGDVIGGIFRGGLTMEEHGFGGVSQPGSPYVSFPDASWGGPSTSPGPTITKTVEVNAPATRTNTFMTDKVLAFDFGSIRGAFNNPFNLESVIGKFNKAGYTGSRADTAAQSWITKAVGAFSSDMTAYGKKGGASGLGWAGQTAATLSSLDKNLSKNISSFGKYDKWATKNPMLAKAHEYEQSQPVKSGGQRRKEQEEKDALRFAAQKEGREWTARAAAIEKSEYLDAEFKEGTSATVETYKTQFDTGSWEGYLGTSNWSEIEAIGSWTGKDYSALIPATYNASGDWQGLVDEAYWDSPALATEMKGHVLSLMDAGSGAYNELISRLESGPDARKGAFINTMNQVDDWNDKMDEGLNAAFTVNDAAKNASKMRLLGSGGTALSASLESQAVAATATAQTIGNELDALPWSYRTFSPDAAYYADANYEEDWTTPIYKDTPDFTTVAAPDAASGVKNIRGGRSGAWRSKPAVSPLLTNTKKAFSLAKPPTKVKSLLGAA